MDIAILTVGRLKAGPEAELCARYLDRARKVGRRLGLQGFSVGEIAESRAVRSADRISEEEIELRSSLETPGRTVCLDAAYELVDSAAIARELSRHAAASIARMTFVVGGPDGLGARILAEADGRWSFGRLTWPHQIVRILLAEQLYRATTILSGHPYHRA